MDKQNISSLKKLTRIYYSSPTEYNKEDLINQANKCTQPIIEAGEQNIAKMHAKLSNPKMAPKTYWSILSRFLNKKRSQ